MKESSAAKAFKMPRPVSIMGRTSTITNSFVNGIIPVNKPSEEEIEEALKVLGMSFDDVRCAYCGDPATEWDHLNPIVKNKKPTGFISEIHNLVPGCGKCNQSKSGNNWREWITGPAPLSPSTRRTADLEERIAKIEEYESKFPPTQLDFEKIVGSDVWKSYWKARDELVEEMKRCDEIAQKIRKTISDSLDHKND